MSAPPLPPAVWSALAEAVAPGSPWRCVGALAALRVTPAEVPPRRWLGLLFGEAELGDRDETTQLIRAVVELYNAMPAHFAKGTVPIPSEGDALSAWCTGFVEAMSLDETWLELGHEPLALMVSIARASTLGDAGGQGGGLGPMPPAETDPLPPAAAAYALHRRLAEARRPRPAVSDKVGRNDPCPCGSGKKHKRCCGR